MIVRVFNTGTNNGNSPVNYLMGNKDHTGKTRSFEPELIEGIPELTIDLINLIEREHKYSSGVIAFKAGENPTQEQLKEVIKDFRKAMLPGLTSGVHFNDLYIAHRENGIVELHFIVPMAELKSDARINIHPPGKRNLEHWHTFNQVENQKLGFNQVIEDPLKAALKGFEYKAHTKESDKSSRIKTSLSEKIMPKILDGSISDRNHLIKYLKQNKVEITRVGKDYISVKFGNASKARRFEGPMFSEGANYADLVKQHHQSKLPQKLTNTEYTALQVKLNDSVGARKEFNTKTYLTPKTSFRRPRNAVKTVNATSVKKSKPIRDLKPQIKPSAPRVSDSVVKPNIQAPAQKDVKAKIQNIRQKSNSKSQSAPTSSGSKIPNSSGSQGIAKQQAGLMASLNELFSQLGQEYDPARAEELKAQIAAIKKQLENLGKDYQEAVSKELADSIGGTNSGKIKPK